MNAEIYQLRDWREIRKRLDERRRWRRIRTFAVIVGIGVVLGLAAMKAGAG